VVISEALRAAIGRGESEQTLMALAGEQRIPLLHDGLSKALAGITSLAEVLRVSREGA